MKEAEKFYRAFHGFGQAKFPDGGLALHEPIFNTAPVASKKDVCFKRGQNQLKYKQLDLLI